MTRKVLFAGAVAAATLALASAETGEAAPLVATTMDFIARASSTSEVLTLNLTNLLILLVLKALIFGFGLFSVGGGVGRSADGGSSTAITQSDLTGGMCFLMYTSGDEEKLECVKRTACEDPYMASDYLTAAKMWYKMHKLMKSVIPFDDKYSKVMHAVKDAMEYGKSGEECRNKYAW